MTNPLLHPSDLPFGVPDFAAISLSDIEEGLNLGMAQEKEEWRAIAENPEPASVINTVVAVDAAGAILGRAETVFYVLLSSVGGPELDALYEKFAPLFSAHNDDFWMNKSIYEKYLEVSKLPDLDEETAWLVSDTVRAFERSGVALDEDGQASLRELNGKIASIQAQVDAKITAQLDKTHTAGSETKELAGLSAERIQSAVEKARDTADGWRIPVMNYSQPPMIASLDDHETRGRALRDSITRGFGGDPELDTRPLIVELVELRQKRAELLGFADHASLAMDDQTVPGPKEALDLLRTVGEAAIRNLDQEKVAYEKLAQAAGFDLGPEDWVYFEDKARGDLLGMDADKLSEYFELNRVVKDGLFFAAERLYGLTFRPRPEIRGWTEDVETYEVFDDNGLPRGRVIAEWYTRPGKSGGAWMSEIQAGSARTGNLPIITNDANFEKPVDGKPTLLTWDSVETCFHEFGHALHGLLTQTYYESTAGTEVPNDFVELPSQLNEMWAYHPEVLANYARHYETGEALPEEVVERLSKSKYFGQAFSTLEYVQAALIDHYWHRSESDLPDAVEDVEAFEEAALAAGGGAHDLVVPRYRTPYFAHTFAGGYDAAYYSYMWAEAMVGELEEWFEEQSLTGEDGRLDGGFNRQAGRLLQDQLLSRGNSRDPLASFVAVRGRKPEGSAVTRRRGLQ